jgi:hypothetical protein
MVEFLVGFIFRVKILVILLLIIQTFTGSNFGRFKVNVSNIPGILQFWLPSFLRKKENLEKNPKTCVK